MSTETTISGFGDAQIQLDGRATASASWAGILLGLWLTGVFASSLVARSESEGFGVMVILAAGVLWPLFYFMVSSNRFFPSMPSTSVFLALIIFAVFGGASIYVSPIIWTSFAYYGMTLCALLIALQFNSALTAEQYRRGLSLYAFCTCILLSVYAIHHYQPGERLGNGSNGGVFNPNAIALVSLSVIAAGFAIRRWLVRLPVLAAGVAVLVLTGSRSAAIGSLLAISIILLKRTKQGGLGVKVVFIVTMVSCISIAIVYWVTIEAAGASFFAVNDSYRGIGTGATGRLDAWIATWGLFTSHPVIGVGFRAHDAMLHALVKTESSAHNGYLSLLAEVGLFGFISFFYIMAAGMLHLWRATLEREKAYIATVFLGLCVGYCFVALFERYLINIGNPTSLLFMLAIFYRGRKNEADAVV